MKRQSLNYLNPNYPMFKLGDKINHDGHGVGTIVELRGCEQLLAYRVKFESGYENNYCGVDLKK